MVQRLSLQTEKKGAGWSIRSRERTSVRLSRRKNCVRTRGTDPHEGEGHPSGIRMEWKSAMLGMEKMMMMQARLHVRSSGFAFSTWLSSGSGECRERTWKELGTVVCSSPAGPGAVGGATRLTCFWKIGRSIKRRWSMVVFLTSPSG